MGTAADQAIAGAIMPKVEKPKPMKFERNLSLAPIRVAECSGWQCDFGDGKGVEFGRAVEVPGLCFDEGDAKKIRTLAAWLKEAADWVEATS